MLFTLSILIPEDSWAQRKMLVAELEQIFKEYNLDQQADFPSLKSDEEIMYLLEQVMFSYYPSVKDQYLAFCQQYDYAHEPLNIEVAREFWILMTARELVSIQFEKSMNNKQLQAVYHELVDFAVTNKLEIFNSQTGELENLNVQNDYPDLWEEE